METQESGIDSKKLYRQDSTPRKLYKKLNNDPEKRSDTLLRFYVMMYYFAVRGEYEKHHRVPGVVTVMVRRYGLHSVSQK